MVYGTLVDFERTFDAVTKTIGWLHFAVTDKLIITTRLHPLRSIDRVKAAVEKNARCTQPIDLFEMMVVEFQRTLISLVLELTEDLNEIEDDVYGEAGHNHQPRLAPLRRTAVRLHRHLRTLLALLRRAGTSAGGRSAARLHRRGGAPLGPVGSRRPRRFCVAGTRAPAARRNRQQAVFRNKPAPRHPVADAQPSCYRRRWSPASSA